MFAKLRFLAPLTSSSTIHKNMHTHGYMYLPNSVLLDTNSRLVAQYDLDIQYTDCWNTLKMKNVYITNDGQLMIRDTSYLVIQLTEVLVIQ